MAESTRLGVYRSCGLGIAPFGSQSLYTVAGDKGSSGGTARTGVVPHIRCTGAAPNPGPPGTPNPDLRHWFQRYGP